MTQRGYVILNHFIIIDQNYTETFHTNIYIYIHHFENEHHFEFDLENLLKDVFST